MQMEDQDGNAVFLPPSENRALIMAMSFYEKARAAMKRKDYAECLILLLEADELFSICNSKFLDKIDNYALVNLDIVWCYMCLKAFTPPSLCLCRNLFICITILIFVERCSAARCPATFGDL